MRAKKPVRRLVADEEGGKLELVRGVAVRLKDISGERIQGTCAMETLMGESKNDFSLELWETGNATNWH